MNQQEVPRQAIDLELAAEAVEHHKRLLIDLDRRQNQTREGNRALSKQQKNAECYVLVPGGHFFRSSVKDAMLLHEEVTNDTTKKIQSTREQLKASVAHLAMLEGPESALRSVKDFYLRPVNEK